MLRTFGVTSESGDMFILFGVAPAYVAREELELNYWSFSDQVTSEKVVEQHPDIRFVLQFDGGIILKVIACRCKTI